MPEDNVSDETTEAPQVDATATAPTEPVAEVGAAELPTEAETSTTATPANDTLTGSETVTSGTSAAASVEDATATESPVETETTLPSTTETDTAEEVEETAGFETVEAAMAEIAKLRSENAAKRISNRELTERMDAIQAKFGDAGEEFQQGWLDLAEAFAADPNDPTVKAIFAELAGAAPQEGAPSLDENAIFEKVRSEYAANQQKLEVQNIQNKLVTKARELGYDPDSTPESDPIAYANNQLLWAQVQTIPAEATDTETTRLEKADAAVKAYEQSVLDRKLAELSAANTGIPVTSGAGTADQSSEDDSTPPAGLSPKQKMKWAYDRSIRLAEQQKQTPSF